MYNYVDSSFLLLIENSTIEIYLRHIQDGLTNEHRSGWTATEEGVLLLGIPIRVPLLWVQVDRGYSKVDAFKHGFGVSKLSMPRLRIAPGFIVI